MTPYNKTIKLTLKCLGVLAGLILLLLFFRLKREGKKTEAESHEATPPTIRMPQSYNYYTSDPRVDVKGSCRKYQVEEGATSDWISLVVPNETIGKFGMITGDTFRGRLGFDPKTLKGVWVGEHPNQGDIQKAKVTLAKNSYGGYDTLFKYEGVEVPVIGTLTPNW